MFIEGNKLEWLLEIIIHWQSICFVSRNLHRDEKRDTITTVVDHGIFRNRIQKITYTSWF